MNKNDCVTISCFLVALMALSAGSVGQENSPKSATPVAALPGMAPMKGTPTLAPIKDSDPFSFVVFGDSQGDKSSPTVLERIITEIHSSQKTKNPVAFAISLGDFIHGEPPAGRIDKEKLRTALTKAKKVAATAKVPVFNAPGNHELDDVVETDGNWIEIPSVTMRGVYEEVIGQTNGSFEYGNSCFIILNSEEVPPPPLQAAFIKAQEAAHAKDPNAPEQEFSYLGKDQFLKLEASLDANTDKAHVFIAMHYPIHPHDPDSKYGKVSGLLPESRKQLLSLINNKKYSNISFVLASHQHLYYNHHQPDNVTRVEPYTAGDPTRYMVSGGAGASMHPAPGDPKYPENFYHYLKFTVDGKKVSVTIHRID